VTTESAGRKPGNGNESKMAATARKGVESSAEDIQDDFQSLQDDVARLTQQLVKLAAAKGGEAWGVAKDNLDEVMSGAKSKGREMADAVGDVRDNLASAIDESIERRPYTTLGLALAMGFIAGAMWKR
jgi:ElaB/YqjD/DUF883 family membrane-anchored ribosome-binding protein